MFTLRKRTCGRPNAPSDLSRISAFQSVDNFVRRGGNHNLGVTLITQRSAVLNKDVLTQSDCLMILRTLAPQDKKAIQAWVEEQTDEDKTALNTWYDSLKSLKNGEAWVWHPEPPAIHERIMFRRRETFHATREFLLTPEASKITLMSVDEFLDRFTKVFKSGPSTAKMAQGQLDPGLVKELEEYRSGNKLAESVQKRLTFLGEQVNELTDTHGKAVELISELKEKLAGLEYFEEALAGLLIPRLAELIKTRQELTTSTPGSTDPSILGLQRVVTVVDLEEVKKQAPKVPTDTVKGKILQLAKAGFFDNWQSVGDINGKLVDAYRFNTSDQAINGALKELVDEAILGMKHTDRNRWKLSPDVVFKGKEVETK